MNSLQKTSLVALPVLCLIGGVALWAIRSKPAEADARPSTLAPLERTGKGVEPAFHPRDIPASGEIDLLGLIRIGSDSIQGSWVNAGGALVSPSVQWGRLMIPCLPPPEYDLRLKVTRKQGTDSLNIGFVYGGRQGMLMIDGNGGETSWIDLITPYDLPSNETSVVGRYLKWNRMTAVVLSVRRTGVSVAVDGTRIMDWKGDPQELKLIPGYRIPDRRALFIGCWETVLRFDEVALVPVSGTPQFLR